MRGCNDHLMVMAATVQRSGCCGVAEAAVPEMCDCALLRKQPYLHCCHETCVMESVGAGMLHLLLYIWAAVAGVPTA
jgi:hypothetical protein